MAQQLQTAPPLTLTRLTSLNSNLALAFDPSGSFEEGKGVSGLSVIDIKTKKFKAVGEIQAVKYKTKEAYWQAHIDLLEQVKPGHLVIEDFLLYAKNAKSLINSRFETSQLLGVMKFCSYRYGIKTELQLASMVKGRWSNYVLEKKGYIKPKGRNWQTMDNVPLNGHIIDSMRHALHYANFKAGDE